jgi:hypothetical protein
MPVLLAKKSQKSDTVLGEARVRPWPEDALVIDRVDDPP